jgi:5-methylcytosine-specific restriction endonuclease McrA
MPLLKACSICGRPSPTSRCSQHPKPPKRSGTYTRNAAKVRASATRCYLCGKPFTAEDPAVADHVHPRAYGGSDELENLRPAHRSCNGRKGADLPGWSRHFASASGSSTYGMHPVVAGAV